MDRKSARAAAMKLLYEWEMGGDGGVETREGMLEIRADEKEVDYMEMLVAGVRRNVTEIDALIAKYAVGWRLERIARVNLSILRVAIFEINYTELSNAIAVNEALELVRTYSAPDSVRFVNGVLGSLIRGK